MHALLINILNWEKRTIERVIFIFRRRIIFRRSFPHAALAIPFQTFLSMHPAYVQLHFYFIMPSNGFVSMNSLIQRSVTLEYVSRVFTQINLLSNE